MENIKKAKNNGIHPTGFKKGNAFLMGCDFGKSVYTFQFWNQLN